MKHKHKWIGMGAVILGIFLGMSSLALRGLFNQIQTESFIYFFRFYCNCRSTISSFSCVLPSKESRSLRDLPNSRRGRG